MRFARIVFIVAGIWGITVLTPLYFLFDISGRQYAPPATYPQFFYGFLAVTMAWQIAFLVIGSNVTGRDDLILGAFFVIAFVKTTRSDPAGADRALSL
jgi:hypothetical protein